MKLDTHYIHYWAVTVVGARGPGPVEVGRRDTTVGPPDLSEYTRWGVEGLRHGLSP